MSRKTLLISVAILIVICVAVFYFFFRSVPTVPGEIPGGTTCLVFQDTDPNQPCFVKSTGPVGGSTATTSVPGNVSSSTPATSTTAVSPFDTTCAGASNEFEKNDCVSKIAVQNNNKTICDYVSGALAQDACRRNISASSSVATSPSVPQTYQDFVQKYFVTTAKTSSTPNTPTIPNENNTPKISPSDEAKVRYGLSYGAPLAVYSASRYQVAPSTAIKIYGSGFAPSGNVLNIGAVQTTLDSADGFTLDAVSPASTGDYDIWVTNTKGSSRVAERPIKITVTNTPAELPAIEKATPSPVAANGTVVLTGTGFASSNNILTSLGILMNVPSDGHTITISMSSLPYISYATGAKDIKGKISPVLVNIQTTAGASEKLFQFDVQF